MRASCVATSPAKASPTPREDITANVNRLHEPTEEEAPAPLARDLVWVWLIPPTAALASDVT
jgi:hypothetical protein